MTTLPDPNDRIIVNKVMDRIFKRDEQLSFADVRLLENFEGHAHRVMETTVNTVSRFTGLSVNIPDPVARQIVGRGGTHLLSMDIQGQTRKALFQGLAESRAAGYHPSSAATRRLIQRHVTAGRFTKMVDRYGRPNGHIYRAKMIARTETMPMPRISPRWQRTRPATLSSRARSSTTRQATETPTAWPGTASWARWTSAAAT